jgi:hypothetical protein
LIVAAKWWPLSARMGAALLRAGCRLNAHCPAGHPLRLLSGLERVSQYSGVRSLQSLSLAIELAAPDFIVPCDDGVVAQLHAIHRAEPAMRDVIERSIGDPDGFATVGSRFKLLSAARHLGIPIPETRQVLAKEDLVSWYNGVAPAGVLKVDGESGGNGVWMCGSFEESLAAWHEAKTPQSIATAWKRLAIDADPLALWTRKGLGREVSIQRVIHGRPANSMMVCRGGKVLSQVSVVVLASEGPTGASTIVQRLRDGRMECAAVQLAARLGLTGFYGLDFMIETETGTPYLIEMNPRCTQLGHIEFSDQSSLAATFSANVRGETRPAARRPVASDTIALYPQALEALGDGSRYGKSSYLDVPWDDPQLAEEIKLGPWPQRRLRARLYHSLKPAVRPACVEYEAFGSNVAAG